MLPSTERIEDLTPNAAHKFLMITQGQLYEAMCGGSTPNTVRAKELLDDSAVLQAVVYKHLN